MQNMTIITTAMKSCRHVRTSLYHSGGGQGALLLSSIGTEPAPASGPGPRVLFVVVCADGAPGPCATLLLFYCNLCNQLQPRRPLIGVNFHVAGRNKQENHRFTSHRAETKQAMDFL